RSRRPSRRAVAAPQSRARLCPGARRAGPRVEAGGSVHARAAVRSARHGRHRGCPGDGGLMARARDPLNFAEQLERLEEIVRRLEGEDLDLDAALKLFEEGVERLRQARERLTAAEAQVKQVLTDQAGNVRVEDLDA